MVDLCKYAKEIREHFLDKEGKGSLADTLKKRGVPEAEASDISRITEARMKKITTGDSDKILESLLKHPEIKANSKIYKEIIEDGLNGKLNDFAVRNRIAKDLNLPTLHPNKIKRITRLSEEIQVGKKTGMPENKLKVKSLLLQREILEAAPNKLQNKLDTFTTFNLLFDVKTALKNTVSNENELFVKTYLEDPLKNIFTGKFGKKKKKKTDSALMLDIRKKVVKELGEDIKLGIRRGEGNDLAGEGLARTFRPEDKEGWGKAFETLGEFQEKALRWELEVHDKMVRELTYTNSLLNQVRGRKGVGDLEFKTREEFETFVKDLQEGKIKGIDKKLAKDMHDFALFESGHLVLQDDSVLAKATQTLFDNKEFKNIPVAGEIYSFLAGTVSKFRKTPANVVIRALERDLLAGSLITGARFLMGKKLGKSEYFLKQQVLSGIAKTLVGTFGMGTAGAILSGLGVIVPEGYKGTQVIKLGESTFNLAPLMVFFPQLGMGANIEQSVRQAREESTSIVKAIFDGYGNNLKNLGTALLDMPLNTGIKKIAEMISPSSGKEAGENFKEKAVELIVNGGTQFLPFISLLRSFARASDNMERDTYDKEGWKKAIKYAMSNIPGVRQMLDSKIDTAGKEVEARIQNTGLRTLDAFFNPTGTKKSLMGDPVWKELSELKKSGNRDKAVFDYAPNKISSKGKKFELTTEEKREYQKVYGEFTYNKISRLKNSNKFNSLPTEKRAELIKEVEKEGKEKAKDVILRRKGYG